MADEPQQKIPSESGLLPIGVSDLMPEQAMLESSVIASIMASFSGLGYMPVKPPLVEFEDTLLADGPGAALAKNTFRVMDPQTSMMMAIRADMTAQIARIASTRLAHLPRPLRLGYSGDVLRVKPDPLNPERQLTQVGAEMIGARQVAHDAELAVVALAALQDAGVANLTIDLGAPRLLSAIYPNADTALTRAVAAKDYALARRLLGQDKSAEMILMLLGSPIVAGDSNAQNLIAQLSPPAAAIVSGLFEMAALIDSALPDVAVTIDPLESRGFDYHHGVGFSIFGRGIRGELGRGGRYRTQIFGGQIFGGQLSGGQLLEGEESTGVTLYLERILRALPPLPQKPAIYIPYDAGLGALVGQMRRGGYICRFGASGLTSDDELNKDARQLGCGFRLQNDAIIPVNK